MAALAGSEVVVVNTSEARVTARHALPGPGSGLFAAPDGCLLVPLADRDGTVRIPPLGKIEVLPGRVFPLFHDEADRMVVVMAAGAAVLSYPERLELRRVPIPFGQAWRAALSRDGQLLAVVAGPLAEELVTVDLLGGRVLGRSPMESGCRSLAMEPRGSWIAVGCRDGAVHLVRSGAGATVSLQIGGSVTALAAADDGRQLVAGVTLPDGTGLVVTVRVPERSGALRVTARAALPGGVPAVAVTGDVVAAATAEAIHLFARRRLRRTGTAAVPGIHDLAVIPGTVESLVPAWSEGGGGLPPVEPIRP